MIQKSSNIVICQLDLLKEVDKIKNLIKISQLEMIESVNKQSFPLLYELALEDFVKRLSSLKNKIEEIENRIREVK